MKTVSLILTLLFLLSACAPAAVSGEGNETILTVTDGNQAKQYTPADLQQLGAVQADFREVTYVGIPLAQLLGDAGFDAQVLSAVKVTAKDGFTVNYGPDFFLLEDTLVAYARLDGPLAEDELPFRMVLPAAEGKMNARQVVEILVIP